jgi:hypothetical protein
MRTNGRWIFNVPIERERCTIDQQTIAVCNAQSRGGRCRQCGLPNSPLFHHDAYSSVVKQRMLVAPVRLQDLPSKTSHRLLRSVTWTGIDAGFTAHIPLRQLFRRIARLGQRLANLPTAIARPGRRP